MSAKHIISKLSIRQMVKLKHGIKGLHAIFPFTYRLYYYQTSGIKNLGIPPFKFTDGPKGINLNRSTCFPVPIARGATFDPKLEERVGTAMGLEAIHQGANAVGSACINIIRHPCWGRSQESFSADPYHMSVMASAHVRGLAKNVIPVIKHFACNSIENTRFKVNVNIDERTLREIYLPHFKAAIDAGAAVIMSAYNKVNGCYCGKNKHLLKEILRDEWNFKGFVISDFFLGCRSTVASIKAGLDIEMPVGWYYRYWRIQHALKKQLISRKELEGSCLRIIETMHRVGIHKEFRANPKKFVCCKEHTDLSLEVARKSIVLLKNESRILPLSKHAIKNIVIIGKHAKKVVLGDIASSAVKPPWKISLLDAITEKVGKVCNIYYASSFWKAKKIAVKADVVIVLISFTWRDEGENIPFGGGDRKQLELPYKYIALIKNISKINKNCIVVLQGGSAICVDDWIDNIPALIMAWYPGMQGGRAIADVLFGDYNPSGRLPISIPKSTKQLPVFDSKSSEVIYDYWHDYRFFDKNNIEPRFYFGYGLSYSHFQYINIKLSSSSIPVNGYISITITLMNEGPFDGEEVIQIYIDYRHSRINPRCKRELKRFKRIFIGKGKKATVKFYLNAKDLSWYDPESKEWRVEKMKYYILAGSSLAHLPLCAEFEIY